VSKRNPSTISCHPSEICCQGRIFGSGTFVACSAFSVFIFLDLVYTTGIYICIYYWYLLGTTAIDTNVLLEAVLVCCSHVATSMEQSTASSPFNLQIVLYL